MEGTPFIPEFIRVHLGAPSDTSVQNVTVPFPDYIKNVASGEIYPTWPESAIRANIYAQISYALNRYYTEWYPSQGYDFDITSTTQYDQTFAQGREIFENISQIVDDIFNDYIVRGDNVEPLFAQYCNGTTSTCDGLSQWGTVDLANEGLGAFDILTYYYGTDINLVTDAPIRAPFASYPGFPLRLGDAGDAVRTKQIQLNRISANYPSIPKIYPVDGVFGPETEEAVRTFQRVFGLTQDGIIGKATWYRIAYLYTSVKRLSELDSEGLALEDVAQQYPSILRLGDTGLPVRVIQYYLGVIGQFYETVPPNVRVTGTFDETTRQAVLAVQRTFGIAEDGIVGRQTWNQIYRAYRGIIDSSDPLLGGVALFPGNTLRIGSQGEDVRLIQEYLQYIAQTLETIPEVEPTGVFGNQTDAAVRAIQEQYGIDATGIVGAATWEIIAGLYSDLTSGNEKQTGQYPGYPLEQEASTG